MSTVDPDRIRYRDWLSAYWDRREQLFRGEVMRVGEEAFQAAVAETEGSLDGPRFDRHARPRRSSLAHRYCLLLWTGHGDLSADQGAAGGQKPDYADALMVDILTQRPTTFRSRMAGLTFALDQAGFFALMLYPEGKAGAPPEPLVLPSPATHVDRESETSMRMWLYIFTGFVELAQAVIVDGDVTRALAAAPDQESGLRSELDHMQRVGLLDHLLLLDQNNELYRLNDSHRWPLERVGDAVAIRRHP
jgi:hypothetical protein